MTRRTVLGLVVPATLCSANDDSKSLTELKTPAGPESGYYNLVLSPQGQPYLSWLESGAERALLWSRFQNGAWSAPRKVTTAASANLLANWADFPSLCPLGDGRMAAHWLVRHPVDKFATSIRIGFSDDDGRTWRLIFQAGESLTSDYSGFVALARTRGGFGAVYLSPPANAPKAAQVASHGDHEEEHLKTLRWAEFGNTGALVSDEEIDADVCTCCQTSAVVASGGPVVAYRDHDGEVRDIAVIGREGGKWSRPRPLHRDDWRINACPVNGPSLAARGSSVAAAWFTGAGNNPRVQIAFSKDGGRTFLPPVRLDGGNAIGRACASMLDDGTVVAVWIERTTSGEHVMRVRRASPDGRLGPVVDVSAVGTGRASGFPRIVPVDGGRLMAAWRTDRVRTGLLPMPGL